MAATTCWRSSCRTTRASRYAFEVLSRGTLAPEQTVEGFFAGESVPVNKALAERVLQLHISEGSGRGVPKIVGRYGREAIDLREKSICVTLPFERVGVGASSPLAANRKGAETGLSENRRKILSAMRDHPNVSQPELAAIVGISRNAVTKNIAWLREHGLVERVGAPRTGWWRVLPIPSIARMQRYRFRHTSTVVAERMSATIAT